MHNKFSYISYVLYLYQTQDFLLLFIQKERETNRESSLRDSALRKIDKHHTEWIQLRLLVK
jgi:hypothetical protein